MKIGILGAGNVGGTLGRGLAAAGHTVRYGVRDAADPRYAGLGAVGSPAQAARDAEVVILATPWAAAADALAAAGDLAGKVLIDATNPLGPGLTLTHGHNDSGAEQVARWAPGARVVKAFNSTGAENMASPQYPTGRAAMFVCGDDAAARATALKLTEDLGFEGVDAGPLARARLLEPLAVLWIRLAMASGRGFALGVLRRG